MDFKKVVDHYNNSLQTYGPVPKGVGWKDKGSVYLRYYQLCKIISEEDRIDGVIINDFGCGFGSLVEYFVMNGLPIKKYYGYDICPLMIESFRYRSNNFEFPSEIKEADYSFISGTFTVRSDIPLKKWEEYIKKTLIELSNKSKKGLAFNMLSTYVDWKSEGTYYGNPEKYFSFCKTNLSKYITLIHDYPLFEWTILVRK